MDQGKADLSGMNVHDGNVEDLMDRTATPMQIGKVVLMPANNCRTGRAVCRGAEFVQLELFCSLTLHGEGVGQFVRLTPEGARMMAAELNQIADQVDASLAKQASAAIEQARKSGGRP